MRLERYYWKDERCFSFYLAWNVIRCVAINFEKGKGCLNYDAAEALATHIFKGLLYPDEIVEAFGELHISKEWKTPWSNKIALNHLSRKEVRNLTKQVKKWWKKGIKKCEKKIKESQLKDWLEEEFVIWEG